MKRKIDKYTIISTKNGDKGTSRNYSNDILSKTDLLFEALGSIDELSSMLGLSYHYTSYQKEIKSIQLDLQHINSIIATRMDDKNRAKLVLVTQDDINRLEQIEQHVLEDCSIEPRFVLPGSDSTKEGAYLDLARAISRRVERTVLAYKELHKRIDLDDVCTYLNRLSDVLFILARSKDQHKKITEY